MKYIYTFGLILIIKISLAQSYTWAITEKSVTSTGVDVVTDNNQNLFVARLYTVSANNKGISIEKYDTNHNLLWSQKITGNNLFDERFCGLEVDNIGSIYLTCTFSDTIKVNGLIYYTPSGSPAMLLVKYDMQGQFQWAKKTNGDLVCGKKVSLDPNNNVYVAGNITGNNYFDSVYISIPPGAYCNFIAKYNKNGDLLWVRKTGTGNSMSWGFGFKMDAAGNGYMAGNFISKEIFGTYTVNAYGGAYFEDVYLAKIDSSGNWLWATHAGGNDGSQQAGLYDLALDGSGNPYICGFTGYATTKFGTVTVTNTGEDDWFLAKYDPNNGNCSWAKCGGGPGSQWATGLCIDNANNIYMARTGTFFSKFDGNGNYLWSDFRSSTFNLAMTKDNIGNIYFTGKHNNSVSFGSFNLSLTSPNQYQCYVAELTDSSSVSGFKENNHEGTFEIYPNPSNQYITISCSDPIKNCFLRITNSSGQPVYHETLKEIGPEGKQINVSLLPKGLYIIELINPNNKDIIRAKKLIIE